MPVQDSDGGVFHVESGSTARFEVPVSFESNSVTAGYSGGAVYAGGLVRTNEFVFLGVCAKIYAQQIPARREHHDRGSQSSFVSIARCSHDRPAYMCCGGGIEV